MFLRKIGFAFCAVLAVAGCDRSPAHIRGPVKPTAAAARGAPPSPTAVPTQAIKASDDAQGGLKFPQAGTPYDKARDLLLGQGATVAPNRVTSPHPIYRELDCSGHGEAPCTALFLSKDAGGWSNYIVVATTGGDAPKVVDVDWARTADGLPPIPPPVAADIPKLPNSYTATRSRLLALGFKPTHAAPDCSKVSDDGEKDPGCLADPGLPEVAHCFPTGAGQCTAYWLSPDGQRVLKVTTIGEPQPGKIYYLEWASAQDTAELPAHWRP